MRKTPLKKRSKNPQRTLMRKAVETFNKWIRERDKKRLGGKCYTCNGVGSEAGHFRHNNNATRFSEIFCNLQCTKCNRYLSGNLGEYALRLIKKYGMEKYEKELKKSYQSKTYNLTELRNIISKYEIK